MRIKGVEKVLLSLDRLVINTQAGVKTKKRSRITMVITTPGEQNQRDKAKDVVKNRQASSKNTDQTDRATVQKGQAKGRSKNEAKVELSETHI